MTKDELKIRAKYYTIEHPVEPSAVTTVESAFIAGFELSQQNLQQTRCTAPLPCEHRWQYDEEIEGAKYCKLCGAMA